MNMKIYGMFAASLLMLGSCTEQDEVSTPVQTGDEISFGIAAPDKLSSRTIYGTPTQDEKGNWYFPVYWEQDDEIAIFCPQADQPSTKLVNYRITPDKCNPATSSAVTKIGDGAGLQWGVEKTHRFFGFYPASAVIGADPTKQEITASIPVTQKVKDWTYDASKKTVTGVPDTKLAYMYAFTQIDDRYSLEQGQDIPLIFKPLVTILEIEVNGPRNSSNPVAITNINIDGVAGNPILTGEFTCPLDEKNGTIGECKPVESAEVRNRISIPCYDDNGTSDDPTDDTPIKLKPGQKLNVKAFIVPDDVHTAIQPRRLRITVSVLGGAAKSKLLQTAEIVPHKVNRVSLPALEPNTDPNYWMSNLDPNVYVTELSIPGSKMSLLTADNVASNGLVYQASTIEEQYQAGVRAFILQTKVFHRRGGWYDYNNFDIEVCAEGTSVMTVDKAIQDIANYLATSESSGKDQEFAFVMFTYQGGDAAWWPSEWDDAEKFWIAKLRDKINSLSETTSNRIYTPEVTANTTIEDVKGKIIVKANYNTENMISGYTGSAPILFTHWDGPYPEYQEAQGGMPMTWGSPNNTAKLKWYYQEVTSVNKNNQDGAEATYNQKVAAITNLFQKSVNLYQNSTAHDTWFMNDLGGYYKDQANSVAVKNLATDMNALGVSELQTRTENAGLGLIFMNFADRKADYGQLYKSDWLIQTIIDNNFKFALRKKTSSGGGEGTKSYNASYSNGGNAIGWDK